MPYGILSEGKIDSSGDNIITELLQYIEMGYGVNGINLVLLYLEQQEYDRKDLGRIFHDIENEIDKYKEFMWPKTYALLKTKIEPYRNYEQEFPDVDEREQQVDFLLYNILEGVNRSYRVHRYYQDHQLIPVEVYQQHIGTQTRELTLAEISGVIGTYL